MPDVLWRIVERRLQRALPPAHASSTIGDLAEDYAGRGAAVGRLRAACWLVREAWSLAYTYRVAHAVDPERHRLMLTSEIRYAVRRLTARAGPSLACAGLLGVGIGLCTAAFSVVDAVLLQPAPFRDGDRIVEQGMWYSEPALMDAWRASGMFEAVEAGRGASFQFRTDTDTFSWPGAEVTPGVFDMLGVRPLRGRTFSAMSGRAGPADEVIVSEQIWRAVFASDPTLLGRRIRLGEGSAVVVGIMPGTFRFPTPATVAWTPLSPAPRERGLFTIFGRLKPGVPLADVEARIRALAQELARLPPNYAGGPPVRRLGEPALGESATGALWLLLAGAALVFAVLCANVSGLVLTSLSARRREFGVCTALGASRARLIREALVEHTLIGIVGASVGVWLAWGLTTLVPSVFQGHTLNLIDVDLRALLAASSLGVVAVVLSGLIPAWLGTRTDPVDSIRVPGQAATDTRMGRIAGRGLLVAEVGLACSLLVGSALLVRSFANIVRADRGLNSDGVLRVRVLHVDDATVSSIAADPVREGQNAQALRGALTTMVEAIEERFAAWPEIRAVALSRELPPNPAQGARVHAGAPGTVADLHSSVDADGYRVGASFFELYGIPIRRGRTFRPGDTMLDVIVSERLAERLWPGVDPLGQSLSVGRLKGTRVIGVAGEIRLPSLDSTVDLPEFYTPLGNESRTLYLNIRCREACPTEAAIQAQVQAVHPVLRARNVSPAEETYLSERRLLGAMAEVAGLFAVVAVLTAAVGLFSVLTCAVGRRRREFGIRTALGATPNGIQRLVIRDGMPVVGIGIAAGACGGWLVARSLAAFHYGVASADPVTWGGVLATVTLTVFAAAWYPARQAARTDTVSLLRDE